MTDHQALRALDALPRASATPGAVGWLVSRFGEISEILGPFGEQPASFTVYGSARRCGRLQSIIGNSFQTADGSDVAIRWQVLNERDDLSGDSLELDVHVRQGHVYAGLRVHVYEQAVSDSYRETRWVLELDGMSRNDAARAARLLS